MKPGQCVSVVNTTGDQFIGKSAQPTYAQVQEQKDTNNIQCMAIPHVRLYMVPFIYMIIVGLDSSTLQI